MIGSKIIFILSVILMMSAGQILFKIAALKIKNYPLDWIMLQELFTNPYMICGIALYGLTTLLWVLILRDMELSRVYPFMALNFFLVPIAGKFLFNENLTLGLFVGCILIVIGLLTICLF